MSPGHKIEFGVYFPQMHFTFDDIKQRVQLSDELGFHSAWFFDHLYPPGMPQLRGFEAWTLISALAAVTERIRLGHLVLCNGFRHPAVLGKMATTLDAISNGRLDIGIGTGSHPQEFEMFGLPFPSNRERIGQLDEAIQVLKLLFTQELSDFEGKYYTLKGAPSLPLAVQKPHPPIHVGGGGEKLTLPLVARHADVWNCPTYSLGELAHKIEVLQAECRKIGRDPASLRISEEAVLALAPRKQDVEPAMETARRRFGGGGWGLEEGGFVGTPDDVIRQIREKADLGVSLFVFFLADRGKRETLELFAKEVAPAFA